jgi:PAS domain S-box-containing protein
MKGSDKMNSAENPDLGTTTRTINQDENFKKIKVLHIDDSEDFLNLFSLAFRKWFEVTSLSCSLKAMDMIRTNQFEAVITDYEMPDMNGMELLKAIKKEYSSLPVIFYTGQGNEEITREAFISGVTDYFTKEFRGFSMKERLVNSIKHAVDRMRTEAAYLKEKDNALRYFNIANVITLLLNADQKVEMLNNYGLDLLEYSEEEILGKNWFDTAVPSNIREKRKSWFKKIISGKINDDLTKDESEVITKNGEIRTITWSNSLIRNQAGEIEAILRSGLDITERKQSLRYIKHLNRVLKTIRNINQVIFQETCKKKLLKKICQNLVKVIEYKSAWIVVFDEQMRLVEAEHEGLEEDYGIFRETLKRGKYTPCIREMVKRKSIMFVDTNDKTCEKCDFKYTKMENARILLPIKKDNNVIGVLVVVFTPEMNIDKEEQQLLQDVANDLSYALFNIDLRKIHEEYEWALIQSEEDYRTIFDSAHDAIFVLDIETEKMVDANLMACELFKITMDEALNIRVEDFASGIPDKQALVKLEEVLKGKSQRFKTHLFDKKDRKFPVEICAKQIIIRDRDCVLINIREIDDR